LPPLETGCRQHGIDVDPESLAPIFAKAGAMPVDELPVDYGPGANCSASSNSLPNPLPIPIDSVRAEPDDSWQMLEQSGRLLVPKQRTSSW